MYGKGGELLRVTGRFGAGPGEFSFPVAITRLTSGALAAVDFSLRRITVLTSDTMFAFPVVGLVPIDIAPYRAGQMVVLGREARKNGGWRDVLRLYDIDGSPKQLLPQPFPDVVHAHLAVSAWPALSAVSASEAASFVLISEGSDSLILVSLTGRTAFPLAYATRLQRPKHRDIRDHRPWRVQTPLPRKALAIAEHLVIQYQSWPDTLREVRRLIEVYSHAGNLRLYAPSTELLLGAYADTLIFVDNESIPRVLKLRTFNSDRR